MNFLRWGGGASPVSYEIAKGYVRLGYKVDIPDCDIDRFKLLHKFMRKYCKTQTERSFKEGWSR